MKYVYFVSFSHSEGFGNIEITVGTPIDNFDKINQIQDLIMSNEEDFEEVVVMNFVLLEEIRYIDDKKKRNERGGRL